MADEQFKIEITSEADNSGFVSAGQAGAALSQEMGGVTGAEKDVAGGAEDVEKGFGKMELGGRELRHVCGELNRIIPGVGTAIRGLATGAGIATVAILALQAAMTYYKMYCENAASANEALTKSLDIIRGAFKTAREEVGTFDETMREAARPKNEAGDMLHNAQAVLDAQMKGRRELLKLDEEAELKKAKTEPEKEAIKKKYGERGMALDEIAEQGKLDNIKKVMEFLQEQGEGLMWRHDKLEAQKLAIVSDRNQSEAEKEAALIPINKSLESVTEELKETARELTKYGTERDTGQAVLGINQGTRWAASNRTISKGVEAVDAFHHGETLSKEQNEAAAEMRQLFEKFTGGVQTQRAIIQRHLALSTSQAQVDQALQNALITLQQQKDTMLQQLHNMRNRGPGG